MSITKKIGVAVVVVVAGVVGGGFLAPDHMVVTRNAPTTANPETIIKLASSGAGYQSFNPYKVADPALKIDVFGPASGVGSGFNFDGKDGKGSTVIVAQTANQVDYQIKLDGMGAPTQTIATRQTPQGTVIEWRMQMQFGNNPALRLMGLMMPAMMGPTLENGLSNLNKAAMDAQI
jgi:hypothetical protein